MPVRGVFAEADVRGDEQCWKERSQLSYGEDDGPLGIVRGCATGVLGCDRVIESPTNQNVGVPFDTSMARRRE